MTPTALKMAKISAVICTYDRYDLLDGALNSLKQQTLSLNDFAIIVVDNSPDREKAEAYRARYGSVDHVRYVHTATPGLSHARNMALDLCETDLIAFMDDDAVADPTWLEALVQAFETLGDRAAAVGGPIEPIWDMARPAWLADELLACLTVVDWGGSLRFTNDREWIAGANMAFRMEMLRKAGGFGLALGRNGANHSLLSNEEIEVVQRLKAEGHGVAWAPKARVKHLVSRDRLHQGWFRKRYMWQAI